MSTDHLSAGASRTLCTRAQLAGAAAGAAGWGTCLALLYGPLALACTPPAAVRGLWVITGGAVACWLAALVVERRWPRVPPVVSGLAVLPLVLGVVAGLNPDGVYDAAAGRVVAADGAWRYWPASADAGATFEAVAVAGAAVGLMLVACDLSHDVRWRRRFWATAVLAGVGIAAYGTAQKVGWLAALAPNASHAAASFATFRHHGIAAAFLNLTLPLAVTAAAAAVVSGRRDAAYMWAAPALIAVGVFANASKAGHALAIFVSSLALAVCWHLSRDANPSSPGRHAARWPGPVAVTGLAAVALVGLYVGNGAARWRHSAAATAESRESGRLIMWRIGLGMARDAGPFGEGPGTFKLLYPDSPHFDPALYRNWIVTRHVAGREVSEWSYACNDYLQAAIEWGWTSTAAWASVALAALVSGIGTARSASTDSTDRYLLAGATVALVGVLLHAAVDWPLQLASINVYVGVLVGMCLASPTWRGAAAEGPCASC